MRFLVFLLGALLLATTAEALHVPKGIRYIEADDAFNQRAARLIRRILAGDSASMPGLVGERLILGPGLWRALDTAYEERGCRIASTEFLVSRRRHETIVLHGANIQGCQPVAGILRKLIGAGKPPLVTISRLHEWEMTLHAGLLGRVIREPIFAVEITDEHLVFRRRLLFAFDRKGNSLRLAFLDETWTYAQLQAAGELVPQDRHKWLRSTQREDGR